MIRRRSFCEGDCEKLGRKMAADWIENAKREQHQETGSVCIQAKAKKNKTGKLS